MKFTFEEDDLRKIADFTSDRIIEKIVKVLPTIPENEEHLSRRQTSELLHISLPTLNKFTRAGIITGYRIGGRVLYKKSELTKALKEIPSLKKGWKK